MRAVYREEQSVDGPVVELVAEDPKQAAELERIMHRVGQMARIRSMQLMASHPDHGGASAITITFEK